MHIEFLLIMLSVVADGALKNDGLDVNSATDEAPQQQHNPSSLETENQLLKNEIISLNHEMESAIKRIQSTQDGLCCHLSWQDVSYLKFNLHFHFLCCKFM